MISFEYTYLSQPSRLIEIMKNKNEEYINLDKSNLKFLPNDWKQRKKNISFRF